MYNKNRLLTRDLQICKDDNITTAYCVNTIAVGAVYFSAHPMQL